MQQPVVAVLAGGQGSRMGRDKASIVWDGQPLLERTISLALTVVTNVIVAGRPAPDGWPFDGVVCLPDESPGLGPIGGLASALSHAGGRAVLLLPTDLPLLSQETLRWLCGLGSRCVPGTDGVIVMNGDQIEPACSLYAPSALSLAERALDAGRPSLKAVMSYGNFASAVLPEGLRRSLTNVNTPEDLDALADR